MTREEAIETVKGYLEDYLRGKGINTRHPFRCLSPDHPDKHPSMSYYRQGQFCKCFSCGVKFDILDLIGIDYNLKDFNEKLDKACSLYGITIDKGQLPAAPARTKKAEAPAAADNAEYLQKARARFAGSPAEEYLLRRGISAETAAKHGLGYDECYSTANVDEDGNSTPCKWRALIIPTSGNSYVVRNIDKQGETQKKNRYRKPKGAPSLLFNGGAAYNAQQPFFVVEGELDALSVIEAGGQAVGLGSTSNYAQFVKMCEKKPPVQPVIIAMDADEEGYKAEDALGRELDRLQIPFYFGRVFNGKKDANEALVADREAFTKALRAAESRPEEEKKLMAEAARRNYLNTSAAAHLKEFEDGIAASVNTPAISTGFDSLDMILDGGLFEGLYILGAISSLGKTTLALQIADNIAQSGQDVLVFSLEMARVELMAKSISRHTFLLASDKGHAKTTRGIMNGARYAYYSQKEKDLIKQGMAEYGRYAQHIFIHEGMGSIGIEQVREIVEQHIEITGNRPVVIIDYLQILAPYDMRASDKQNTDKAVLELKRLSRDEKIPVFCISSFNRDSYKAGSYNKGKVSMTDFKESGALEYSADVLIGLEFETAGTSEYEERAEKQKDPRHIRLVILKNRNGRAWETATYNYYPLFNYYEESNGFIPDPGDVFNGLRKKA